MATRKKARKYGSSVGATVKKVMHERKAGTLRAGRSKKKVTSRKQAIAIALSEARAAGKRVPSKTARRKKVSKKRASARAVPSARRGLVT